MKKEKLKIKDIITAVLLTIVNLVIYFVLAFLCVNPILLLVYPFLVSLLQGIVYMMLGIRVPKSGAFLIYGIIFGVTGVYLPYIIGFLLTGILAEILLKNFGYKNCKALTISYIVMQIVCCFTGTIYPYVIALNSTIEKYESMARDTTIYVKANELMSVPVIILLLALTAVAAFVGAKLGERIVRKHMTGANQATIEEDEEK